MKLTHKCPKCGGTDIIKVEKKAVIYHYACASCGYVELYFEMKNIENIKKKRSK